MKNLATISTFGSFLAAFALTLVSTAAFAQSYKTEVEILQEELGLEKKVAVADFIELGENADTFWKIYDEYEVERKELGKERIDVIVDYAQSFQDISDEEIIALFKRSNKVKKSFDKLQNTYFNRMRKEVGVSQAAQFTQIESYFNAIVEANIYSQIPFIGEQLEGN